MCAKRWCDILVKHLEIYESNSSRSEHIEALLDRGKCEQRPLTDYSVVISMASSASSNMQRVFLLPLYLFLTEFSTPS